MVVACPVESLFLPLRPDTLLEKKKKRNGSLLLPSVKRTPALKEENLHRLEMGLPSITLRSQPGKGKRKTACIMLLYLYFCHELFLPKLSPLPVQKNNGEYVDEEKIRSDFYKTADAGCLFFRSVISFSQPL